MASPLYVFSNIIDSGIIFYNRSLDIPLSEVVYTLSIISFPSQPPMHLCGHLDSTVYLKETDYLDFFM